MIFKTYTPQRPPGKPALAVQGAIGALLLAALAFASDRSVVGADAVTIDRATGLRMHQGAPFSGIAVGRHANGRLASQAQFKDGRRHGVLRRWFANGQLSFVSRYENGRRDGETRSWWRNGKPRSKSRYVNDLPDGVAWQWYRTGEKFKRMRYRLGTPTGLQQGWRQNGKLFSNFEIRNGRAYGLRNANLCVELEDENYVASNS